MIVFSSNKAKINNQKGQQKYQKFTWPNQKRKYRNCTVTRKNTMPRTESKENTEHSMPLGLAAKYLLLSCKMLLRPINSNCFQFVKAHSDIETGEQNSSYVSSTSQQYHHHIVLCKYVCSVIQIRTASETRMNSHPLPGWWDMTQVLSWVTKNHLASSLCW